MTDSVLNFRLELNRDTLSFRAAGGFDAEFIGISGPSGSGKTTFFRLLTGLETPDHGWIRLNRRVLTDTDRGAGIPPDRRRIGLVFQENRLFPHMNVRRNLEYGCPEKISVHPEAGMLVEIFGLEPLLEKKPSCLSGGEARRVAVARALLASPECLLLDEPFTGLDADLREELIEYLRLFQRRRNIPVVLVSHDSGMLESLVDRYWDIESGRLRMRSYPWAS